MKSLLFLSLIFLVSSMVQAQSAVEHMEEIGSHFDPINKDTWDYIKTANRSNNVRRTEKKRSDLIATVKSSKYKISKVKAFNGDASLRESTEKFLEFSLLILQDKYDKLIDLEAIANDSYDLMEAYLTTKELISEKMDSANQSYDLVYEEFARANNITLTDAKSKRSKKISNANKITAYYNDVYLAYFKASLQETNYLEALNAGELGTIEQSRQSLEIIAGEELEKVKGFREYEGESDLKDACSDVLYFFYSEAKKYGPEQVNFFLLKSEVDEVSSIINSKKPKDLTKSEIDSYNAKSKAYNEALSKYNETNAYLNKHRMSRLEAWQKAAEKFLGKI